MMSLRYFLGDKKSIFKIVGLSCFLILIKKLLLSGLSFFSYDEGLNYFLGGILLEDTVNFFSSIFGILFIVGIVWQISLPIVIEIKENYIYMVTRKVKKIYICKVLIYKIFVYSSLFSLSGIITAMILLKTFGKINLSLFLIYLLNVFIIALFSAMLILFLDLKIGIIASFLFNFLPYIILGAFVKFKSLNEKIYLFKYIPLISSNYNFYNVIRLKDVFSNFETTNRIICENSSINIIFYQLIFISFMFFGIYMIMRKEFFNAN